MTEPALLAGKVALVTGGAQGLGRMIVEGLLRAGARVYFTSRKADACAEAAAALRALGDCQPLVADLAGAEAAVELIGRVAARENALHILVNNAGKTWGAPLAEFPDKAWPGTLATNVQVPFTLVREALPLLAAAGTEDDPARVINIGSVAGLAVERIDAYSYAASKAALHHLSRVLAAELAQRQVCVNVVVPGYFPTRMTAHLQDDAQLDALKQRIPLRRLGRPADIAGLCTFLASPAAAYITGAIIPLDGGMSGCR